MFIRLDEVDDYYFDNCYATSVGLLNSGGLCLPSVNFFPYGKQLMKEIRETISIDTINRNPKTGLKVAARKLIESSDLKEYFGKVCVANWTMDDEGYGIKKKDLDATVASVFKTFLPKVIHAFAGPLVRQWQEQKISKDAKVGFRPGLKASSAAKERKPKGGAKSSSAKGGQLNVVTARKSQLSSTKGPMKITPDQRGKMDSTSYEQSNKRRKTDSTTEVVDEKQHAELDGKELAMDSVQTM